MASPDAGKFDAEDFRRAFGATPEQMEKLETYAALLRKWQRAVNLIAPDSFNAMWRRHFADSAQLLPFIPPAGAFLDFGAGAGFPGLVIAVLTDERDRAVHLVESNARKCAFLRDVARQTATPVEIHNARIEEIAARGTVTQVDVVMARGVAPLTRLLDLSQPFFRGGTIGLFPKGRRAEVEIPEARRIWRFDLRAHASMTDPDGKVLEIRCLERLEGRT